MAPRRFIVTCTHHCHCEHGHSSVESVESATKLNPSTASTTATTSTSVANNSALLLPTPPLSPQLAPSNCAAPDSPVFSKMNHQVTSTLIDPLDIHMEEN
jgi:hypothetical protein